MKTGKQTGGGGWAAAYLLAAGTLIAVAGSKLSGPSPERRARSLERETARELAAVVETASSLARSRAEEDRRRASERRAALEAALAAGCSLARQFESLPDHADVGAELSRAAGGLARLLPEGVAAAVLAPSGERLFEAGGVLDIDSPRVLIAPAGESLSVAVAWSEDATSPPRPDTAVDPTGRDSGLAEALRRTLAAGLEPGTGLYFVAGDGSVAVEVFPRPSPSMPAGAPAGRRLVKSASGDLETGRLVSARRAVELGDGRGKLTAVAERFLSPDTLGAGSKGLTGTLALAGLGVVAAAAFAHVFYAGFAKPAEPDASCPAVPAASSGHSRRPDRAPDATLRSSSLRSTRAELWGRSILRLRESLGASGEGPDLAACARSPILRALSRCVRHPTPSFLPREVKEWARRSSGEDGGDTASSGHSRRPDRASKKVA